MGTQSKRKKATPDNRNVTAEIKRDTDFDAVRTAILPSFEGIEYAPQLITQTDYVDVWDSIDQLQTNSAPPPAQITGLNVTVGSNNNTLNLVWTASGSAGVISYNIYRSTTSGAEVLIGSVSAPIVTYSDTSLSGATTYYYKVTAVNSFGFESILSVEDSATTSGTLPAQITGLTVTVIGNNQLNLAWTASGAAGLINYKIYRSLTSGAEVFFTTSVTNSYSDISVTAGTAYYYKVSAVNDVGEGALSIEKTATTTGSVLVPALLLHLDGNFNDSSANATPPDAYPPFGAYTPNGFGTPGKFGSSHWKVSTPSELIGGYFDFFYYVTNPTNLQLDLTTGFSYSIWIQPVDVSTLGDGKRRVILENRVDTNNQFSLTIDNSNIVYFQLRKAGSSIKTQITGASNNSWHHIAITYDGVANVVKIYRNGTLGASSTAALEYALNDNRLECAGRTGSAYSYFEGLMDEIQYFKGIVLTSTQVTNLMNTNAP